MITSTPATENHTNYHHIHHYYISNMFHYLFIVHRFHPLLNCLTISGNFICLPWYVLNITEYLIFSIPLCTNGSPTCTNGSILCCVPILLMIKLYLKNNLRKWKLCYILIQCGNILLIS